jgi:hypothetical protein
MRQILLYLTVALICLNSTSVAVELPATIQHVLTENAAKLNGLELTWYQSRRPLKEIATVLSELRTQESEQEFTLRRESTVKIESTRLFECFRNQEGTNSFASASDKRTFDGEKYYVGSLYPTDRGNPGLFAIKFPQQITKDETKRPQKTSLFEFKYLSEIGFQLPTRSLLVGQKPTSTILELIKHGKLLSFGTSKDRNLFEVLVEYPDQWAIDETINVADDPLLQALRPGSREIQLRIAKERQQLAGKTRTSRFLLDPALNYAIKETFVLRDGKTLFHTTCDKFIDVGAELMLPRSCRVLSHTYETRPAYTAEEPLYETVFELGNAVHRTFKPADFQFSFDTPGVYVSDYTLEGATSDRPINYVMPASQDELERTIHEAMGKHPDAGSRHRWLLIANVVAIIMLIVYLLLKKYRTQITSS